MNLCTKDTFIKGIKASSIKKIEKYFVNNFNNFVIGIKQAIYQILIKGHIAFINIQFNISSSPFLQMCMALFVYVKILRSFSSFVH